MIPLEVDMCIFKSGEGFRVQPEKEARGSKSCGYAERDHKKPEL
jgi:hypothetical protein